MPPSDDELDEAFRLAKAAFDDDREAVALELFAAYVRWRPEHAIAWVHFGECLHVVGLVHEALSALENGLEGAPERHRWRVLAKMASAHEASGNREAAEACYVQALESEEATNTTWLWILRGGNLARMTQLTPAEACHRKAASLGGYEEDEAYLNLGLVLRAQGRYAEAADAFRRALDLSPDYPEASEALRSLDGIEDAIVTAKSIGKPETSS